MPLACKACSAYCGKSSRTLLVQLLERVHPLSIRSTSGPRRSARAARTSKSDSTTGALELLLVILRTARDGEPGCGPEQVALSEATSSTVTAACATYRTYRCSTASLSTNDGTIHLSMMPQAGFCTFHHFFSPLYVVYYYDSSLCSIRHIH